MKYCPYCGAGLHEEMDFCPKCGQRFVDASRGADQKRSNNDKSLSDSAKHQDSGVNKPFRKVRLVNNNYEEILA